MLWLLFLVLSSANCEKLVKVYAGISSYTSSPSFPRDSLIGTEEQWDFVGPPNHWLTTECDKFQLKDSKGCKYDYLKIGDEGKFCGNQTGLKTVTKDSKMSMEFKLGVGRGLFSCVIKAVSINDYKIFTNEIPSEKKQTFDIYMKLGDPAYDKIYLNPLHKNVEYTWNFKTDKTAKFSFSCDKFEISKRLKCGKEEIIVSSGGQEKQFCGSDYRVSYISRDNEMSVTLRTGDYNEGFMDCIVQAIGGAHVNQYENVKSIEIESSEHGDAKGAKGTTCKCGWANKNNQRIVNGKRAKTNEFPWMVALMRYGIQFCGGSIITEHHVLTAAHCTQGKIASEIQALVGNKYSQGMRIAKIIDSEYDKNNAHINDISILETEKQIPFSQTVGPVCLTPKQPKIDHSYIMLTGWGNLGNKEYPDMLMKVQMRVVDFETCNYMYNRRFDGIAKTRLCTWASNRDSCDGDSGGPLVWLDPETNRFTQVALVSFGKGCNTNNPKVNTAVSAYYDWIQKVITEDVVLVSQDFGFARGYGYQVSVALRKRGYLGGAPTVRSFFVKLDHRVYGKKQCLFNQFRRCYRKVYKSPGTVPTLQSITIQAL